MVNLYGKIGKCRYTSPMDPMGIVNLIKYDELLQSRSGNFGNHPGGREFPSSSRGRPKRKGILKSYVKKNGGDLFAGFF